jgi:hypothetical protein
VNLASWIILLIVVAVLALAVKATFFKKKSRGGCCDTGDKHDARDKREMRDEQGAKAECPDDLDLSGLMCSSGCSGCPSSGNCASARNNLQPTYKPL